MPQLGFVMSDYSQKVVDTEIGTTVMRAAVDNGVDGVVAACGGECACATCHVYLTPAAFELLGPPSAQEIETLELVIGRRPISRLSCQIPVTAAMDGFVVEVPSEQAS